MNTRVTIIDDSDRIEVLEAALRKIVDWSEACPLERYPEPDYRKAEALLQAGGMSLEVICACNMRHAVEGVGQIARDALGCGTRCGSGRKACVRCNQDRVDCVGWHIVHC